MLGDCITTSGYCPIKVCKLQSSYICGEIKNQIKNNEAYNGTKIGNYLLLSGKSFSLHIK